MSGALLPIVITVLSIALILRSQRASDARTAGIYVRHFTPEERKALGRNADGTPKDS
jgi:hypothetical protein